MADSDNEIVHRYNLCDSNLGHVILCEECYTWSIPLNAIRLNMLNPPAAYCPVHCMTRLQDPHPPGLSTGIRPMPHLGYPLEAGPWQVQGGPVGVADSGPRRD